MDEQAKNESLFLFIELIMRYLSVKGYAKIEEQERQAFKKELLELLR